VRAFVSHFFLLTPPFFLAAGGWLAHPPTSLADGWLQAGGCRRVAAGRRVAFGRRVAAGRRAVADGPSHAARWSCAGFFGLLGRRCAWLVWVGLTFKMATGCAVGKYRWDMTPTASAKLTATNTAEKSYELS